MEFFKIRKDIPFMRHALIFNVVSFVTFALAVFFLFSRGLHLSVEFTGGTVMEVAYQQAPDVEKLRTTVSGLGFTDVQVQNFGTSRDVMIRLPAQKGVSTAQQSDKVITALKAIDPQVVLKRTEFVGPQVGEELAHDGLKALGMVVVGIMIYLAFRFEWKYAVAAIIANLHDVIIILGFFAFFQWEFSLSVLAAVLAVLGYSVNESVVILTGFVKTSAVIARWIRQRSLTTPSHRPSAVPSSPMAPRRSWCCPCCCLADRPVLLCAGVDDRDFVWYLFFGVCGGGHCHVAGYQAEDLIKTSVVKKDEDPNDPNAGATV